MSTFYDIINRFNKVATVQPKTKKVLVENTASRPSALQDILTAKYNALDEGRMAEAENTFSHIIQRYPSEVKQFEAGSEMDDELYDALYDYYLNAGEMPFGIAKARTGDPMTWVSDRFEQDLAHDGSAEMLTPDTDFNPELDFDQDMVSGYPGDDGPSLEDELNEIARLAGVDQEIMLDEAEEVRYDLADVKIDFVGDSDGQATAWMYPLDSKAEADGQTVTINFTYDAEEVGSPRMDSPRFGPGSASELIVNSIDTNKGQIAVNQTTLDIADFEELVEIWIADANEPDYEDMLETGDAEPTNAELDDIEHDEDYYHDNPESMPDEYARPHERVAEDAALRQMLKIAGLNESDYIILDDEEDEDDFKSEIGFADELEESSDSDAFTYQMLSRLQADNEYFLNAGKGSEKHLWAGNVSDQIKEMKKLFMSLEVKPEWISDDDIMQYEKAMTEVMLANSTGELEEERDIEYSNTPNERIGPMNAAIQNGDDMHKSKRAYPATKLGDNPMAVAESKDLWKSYKDIINGVSK